MAGSKGQEGDQDDEYGVVSGHIYTLISVYEIDGLRLLKLRNPSGSNEWTGAYSDNSPLWTPELQQRTGMMKADDGIFFMSFDDYLSHYDSTSVCITDDISGRDVHSQIIHNFSDKKMAFFTFSLTQ